MKDADIIWLYDEIDIRDVLRPLVMNGMVRDGFKIDYYMRNHHLNNSMNSHIYRPNDVEMAEAWLSMGYVPCIDIKFSPIDDLRIIVTELNSLIRHMPEYIIYTINASKIGLKLDETAPQKHSFQIQNKILAQDFPTFESLWFKCIIEKVNITGLQTRDISTDEIVTSLFGLANVSSRSWENPCYVITIEKISKKLTIDSIRSLATAIDVFESMKDRLSKHGKITHDAFEVKDRVRFNIILKEN